MTQPLLSVVSVALWSILLSHTNAFVPLSTLSTKIDGKSCNSVQWMGLYDTPLPSFPSQEGGDKEESPTDEDDYLDTVDRLFQMKEDGTEARGLLPPLSRNLKSGIGCYFETSDRQVQNLASKTACHLEDAAWALEACKGDVTEAWLCISTARRSLLNEGVALPEEETDWDAELFSLIQNPDDVIRPVDREAYQERKKQVAKDEQKQEIQDLFQGGDADEPWLPRPNPNPVDDEPWFTG